MPAKDPPAPPPRVGYVLRIGGKITSGTLPAEELTLSPTAFLNQHVKGWLAAVLPKKGKG